MLDIHDDKLHDECGVFAICNPDQVVAQLTYYGLYALQHRGQESAGIAVSDGKGIQVHKGVGLVSDVFPNGEVHSLKGKMAIGHVRYATLKNNLPENTQPVVVHYQQGKMALAYNGNLVNSDEIREEMVNTGAVLQTSIDGELIINLIARHKHGTLEEAVARTLGDLKGGYAFVVMAEDKIIGTRDPRGIRPLCIGKLDDHYCLASESCALDTIGAQFVRDVQPGEIVTIDESGLHTKQGQVAHAGASCSFEYIYFARQDSTLDGYNVEESRLKMGAELYQECPIDADCVIAVPDSGTAAALGYARASGIPFAEGLVKNRYVGRTFIQPTQAMREVAVRIKLNANRSVLKGKRVVMVDDSIVRGTTSSRLIEMVKDAGATEVHLLISSPPVLHACHYGIDTAERETLIARQLDVDEIRAHVGADTLHYLSIEGLQRALPGLPACFACFNGEYPVVTDEAHTYKGAGVDVDAGNRAVELIKPVVAKTNRPEVLGGIGGFGSLFQLDVQKYTDPVLVSGTDGVGTKLKIAFALDKHDTIGIDAVAMCVNDILVQGAEPLFFLDYLAVGKLMPEQVGSIVTGIAAGCKEAGCALVGGETAEMPGFYKQGEYDVAGFAVGAANRGDIIDGSQIASGDVLIGLKSSGLHSNGYSLARKVFAPYSQNKVFSEIGEPLGDVLLRPTRIYAQTILPLLQDDKLQINGMSHITGGGITENLARIMPPGCGVKIAKSWKVPGIFKVLQRLGQVTEDEMYRTFNMGIGFALIVPEGNRELAVTKLQDLGEEPVILGKVVEGNGVAYK